MLFLDAPLLYFVIFWGFRGLGLGFGDRKRGFSFVGDFAWLGLRMSVALFLGLFCGVPIGFITLARMGGYC